MAARGAGFVAIVACVVVAGCGENAGPPTYPEFLRQKAELSCAAIFKCCNAARLAKTHAQYSDVPSCVQFTITNGGFDFDLVANAWGAPKDFVYHRALAAQCLTTLAAAYVDCAATTFLEPDECIEATGGPLAIGASCNPYPTANEGKACGVGLVCAPNLTDGGQCQKPGALDDACDARDPCDSGLYCDGACATVKSGGAMCASNEECDVRRGLNCNHAAGETSGSCGRYVSDDPASQSALCH